MIKEFVFSDLFVGQKAEFVRSFTQEDVLNFAKLSGDSNPLHIDNDYAKNTGFGKTIVHGILASSLFSALVGTYLPGKHCLYLSQTLEFRKPIVIGQKIIAKGEIVEKSISLKIISVKTEIKNEDGSTLIKGLAKVKLLK